MIYNLLRFNSIIYFWVLPSRALLARSRMNLSFDDPVCTLIEMGIGMATGFAVKANCDCYGNIRSGMEVLCSFDQCVIGSTVCGSVDLGFSY